MEAYNWSKPQRQPLAGLGIAFLNTIWEILKRLWPLLILMLLGENKKGGIGRYEILAIFFLAFTIIGTMVKFLYFRFYIENEKLIIRQGWLKKETKIIPLENIQSVHIEQGPVHQLLNIVKLTVDTAGSQKAEAAIEALHQAMAEALREKLVAGHDAKLEQENEALPLRQPVMRLGDKDLLKLSISANHLKAFFLLLSFVFGLYQNLKDIDNNLFSGIEDFLPKQAVYPILFLVIAVLLITMLVSTGSIFFRFYNFTVWRTAKGYQVKSGLFHVKERVVAFEKIQFVSWKANWLRKLFKLWVLKYHLASADETKLNLHVELPVTQPSFIPVLVKEYALLPEINDEPSISMHPSFITSRLLLFGLLPAVIAMPLLWLAVESVALLVLMIPLLVLVYCWRLQKRFRLWALDDVLYIKRGGWGEEGILLQWHKLQAVEFRQTIFQQRSSLASLKIQTAGGIIFVHFIPVQAARQIMNFALYKTESSAKNWF